MKKQTGFTLIETIISLSLGLLVVAAAVSIFIGTFSSSSNTVRSSRLNYDIDSIMALMLNDIKRAGYWGDALIESNAKNRDPNCFDPELLGNPFTCGNENIQIPVSTCILYTYDTDADGVVNNGEYYGFKLEGDVIKISSADTIDATGNCSATDGRWEILTDDKTVKITALQFSFIPIGTLTATTRCLNTTNISPSPTSSDTTCDLADDDVLNEINTGDQLVENRVVNIIITGEVNSDSDVTRTISGTVQIRNNRIFEQL